MRFERLGWSHLRQARRFRNRAGCGVAATLLMGCAHHAPVGFRHHTPGSEPASVEAGATDLGNFVLQPDPETMTLRAKPIGLSVAMQIDPRGVRGRIASERGIPIGAISIDFSRYPQSEVPGRFRVWRSGSEALVLAGFETGTGSFDAPEGRDEAFWDGAPAFDPRAVFGEFVGTRTAIRERLREATTDAPYGFFLATNPTQPVEAPSIIAVSDALLLSVHPSDTYGGGIRIALATTLVKQLLLRNVGVSRLSASDEASIAGYARAYARDVLRQFGSLDLGEVAGDVNASLATLAASTDSNKSHDTEVNADSTLVRSPQVAAFRADIDGFLRFLAGSFAVQYETFHSAARAAKGYLMLSLTQLRQAPATSDASLLRMRTLLAAHPCFAAGQQLLDVTDFGLDLAATRAHKTAQGVRPDGPVASAGVREGEAIEIRAVRSEKRKTLLVLRRPNATTLEIRAETRARSTLAIVPRAAADAKRCRALP
jgi:hypothetical protein